MKKIIFILFIAFTFNTQDVFACGNNVKKYFSNVQKEADKTSYKWYTGNREVAREYEKSYNKYASKKDYKKVLSQFLENNHDKYYQIGLYTLHKYYTDIENFDFAMELLKKGLEISKTQAENEQIRFLFVIGKALYNKGLKKESLKYLIPAYHLADQYPGNTPSWDSLEYANEVYKFIESNIKKDE